MDTRTAYLFLLVIFVSSSFAQNDTTASPQTTASAGNGTTTASPANETTTASAENGTTTASPVNETTTATAGNETTTASPANETTTASAGNETTTASPANETTTASAGNETTTASAGNETTTASAANETTTTTMGNDTTTVSPGNDTTTAQAGNESTTNASTSELPPTTTAMPERNVVTTPLGKIRGKFVSLTINWNGTDTNILGEEFLGVRYARTPTRFAEPQTLASWTDIQDALAYGANCPQNRDTYGTVTTASPISESEDCLFLNIFVPSGGVEALKAMNETLPVVVYLQSGGYDTMPATLYSGIVLADSGNTIVVTVNYRVGVLGFLALKNAAGSIIGNNGLRDQSLALAWIRDNIASFAGDPTNVTLVGDYKGGASVGLHMVSSQSRGLFHRAISMSGAVTAPWAYATTTTAGEEFLQRADCNRENYDTSLACLRGKSLMDILKYERDPSSQMNLHRPVVDGTILVKSPAELLRDGVAKDIPYVIGYGESDGSFMLKYVTDEVVDGNVTNYMYNLTKLKQILSDTYSEYLGLSQSVRATVESTLFQYDVGPETDNDDLGTGIVKLFTDFFFKAPTEMTTDLYSKSNGTSVFLYNFAYRSTTLNPTKKSFLTAELPDLPYFLFGGGLMSSDTLQNRSHIIVRRAAASSDESDEQISQNVMGYWSNFAETGNPNTGSREQYTAANWPSYDSTNNSYLNLQETPTDARVDMNNRNVQFWNRYVSTVKQNEPTPTTPTTAAPTGLDIGACRRYYAAKIGPEVSPETAAGVMWGMLAAALLLLLVCVVLAIAIERQRRKKQSYKTQNFAY
ncbi:carboxylesterase 1C isoform X2 [Lingula anatina]|uniref:Carboxylesterase 1C isoform X2 n=1 Tax=Lingula anatina TaxID=7574 RepID=A0A1S3HQ80_LINAN|nr:carboxylesterase 1C isoform X2 [Lingula anatina]|eukprot:XP_013387696.1 carboxylesterase 1C isoform X2 [Lingula anatina]